MPALFFSYSHADEDLRDELEKHLTMLKRQGVIDVWHDRRITAGEELDGAISEHVESDDIILLLVSSDFLASAYCYDVEMQRAMERHEAGETVVVPVILRPCDWHPAPFGKLLAAPKDGLPVTKWSNRDEAFLDVTRAIRAVATKLNSSTPHGETSGEASGVGTEAHPAVAGPRSSNLRVTRDFTARDKDQFLHEAFEFMANFFENSLQELGERHQGIDGTFRRIDANRFTATVYRGGDAASSCSVFMGGGHLGGISYSNEITTGTNSYNENLRVEADDQKLFLRSMGMALMGRTNAHEEKLTHEGAAEFYWSILIDPLQRR